MQAVAHNPEFARKTGIPQSVGKEFTDADKQKQMHVARALRSKGTGSIATAGSAAGG